jgi:hypothetical protein
MSFGFMLAGAGVGFASTFASTFDFVLYTQSLRDGVRPC